MGTSLAHGFKMLRLLVDVELPATAPPGVATVYLQTMRELSVEAQRFMMYRAGGYRSRQRVSLARMRLLAVIVRDVLELVDHRTSCPRSEGV